VDRISFSVDGTTKETYERIRIGAKFEDVIENIINLLREKEGK
jgi:MoaA/NifB/PqqE/SkfB family radical SAM enzyme